MPRLAPPDSETLNKRMPKGSYGTLHKFEGIAKFEQGDQDVVINVMELGDGWKIYGVQIYHENFGDATLEVGYEINNPSAANPVFVRGEFCSSPAAGIGYQYYIKKPISFPYKAFITVMAVGTITVHKAEVSVVVEYEDRSS